MAKRVAVDLYLQQQQQLSCAGRSADSLSGSSSSADSIDGDVGLTKQQQEKKKTKTKMIAEEKKTGEKKKKKKKLEKKKEKKKKKGVLSALHQDDGEWQEAEYSDPENNIDGSGAAYSQDRGSGPCSETEEHDEVCFRCSCAGGQRDSCCSDCRCCWGSGGRGER